MPTQHKRELVFHKETGGKYVFKPSRNCNLFPCVPYLYVAKPAFIREGNTEPSPPKRITITIDVADDAYDLTPEDLL